MRLRPALIGLSALLLAATPATAAADPPSPTSPPTVQPGGASALPGDTEHCVAGGYSPAAETLAYTWHRSTGGGASTLVASTQDYVVQSADGGSSISCAVVASNIDGSSAPSSTPGIQVAQALPIVTLRAFSTEARGDIGDGQPDARVRLVLTRLGTVIGTTNYTSVAPGDGRWSAALPGGHGFDPVADVLSVDYDYTGAGTPPVGFPADATYGGNNPYTGFTAFSLSTRASADGTKVSPPQGGSGFSRLALRVKRVGQSQSTTTPFPSQQFGFGRDAITFSPPLSRDDEVTVVAVRSDQPAGPGGPPATSRLEVEAPLSEIRGDVSFLLSYGDQPSCTYDLVTSNATCTGLALGANYDLVRRRGGAETTQSVTTSSTPPTSGPYGSFESVRAVVADARPGDELLLLTPGTDQRTVTRLTIDRLRATTLFDATKPQPLISGTAQCTPGNVVTGVTPLLCPAGGSVSASGQSTPNVFNALYVGDDRSGGRTSITLPTPTDTTPLNGESMFAQRFRVFVSTSFLANVLQAPSSTDTVETTFGNSTSAPVPVDHDSGALLTGQEIGRHTALWTASWAQRTATGSTESSTSSLVTRYVVQESDSGGGQGPAGTTGPAGPAGTTGPAGPAGNTGPAGPAGTPGSSGPAGPAGTPGSSGPAGPAGPPGSSGPAGQAGNTGPAGQPGNTGPAGTPGAAGQPGNTGPAGTPGAAGTQGLPGSVGSAGPKGDAGASGGAGSQGPQGGTGAKGDAGTPGAPGTAGAKGDAGAPGPAGPRGATGTVTCKVKRPSKRSKSKTVKVSCRVTAAPRSSTVRARLARAGRTVATGKGRKAAIHLVAKKRLARGSYTLTVVTTDRRGRAVTTRAKVRIA